MVPKESGFNQSKSLAHYARAHCDVFQARWPWQGIVKLYKGSIFVITETQIAIQSQVTQQPNYTERLHVDATINAIFSDRAIFTFPTIGVFQQR